MIRYNFLFFLTILYTFLYTSNSFAQTNSTENTSFQKEFNAYDLYLQDKNYDAAIKPMMKVAQEGSELELVLAYSNLADAYLLKKEYAKSNHYLNEIKKIAESSPSKIDNGYYNHIKGRIFYRKGQNDDAIKHLLESIKILEKEPNQDIMLGYNYYYLADIHGKIRIYNNDFKKYTQENLKYALKTKNLQLLLMSYTIQTLYYETAYNKFKRQDDLESLYSNSEKLLELINDPKNKNLISNRRNIIALNNYATTINSYPYKNYSKLERIKLAEDYIVKAINIAKIDNTHYDILSYCYLTYGEIQSNLGNEEKAEKYFLEAYNIAKNTEDSNLFINRAASHYLANYYKKHGKMDLAFNYKEEEFNFAKESYEQLIDDKTRYLEAYYNAEHQNQKILQLEEKNKLYSKQVVLYIGVILCAICGLIFLTFMIRYKQKLNQKNTEILEAEKHEAQLTLQLEMEEKARMKAEKELLSVQQEQLQKQALATSLQLNQKKEFINKLKNNISSDNSQKLNRLLKDERLTDEDFNEIQNIVQEVHPNLFKKLNEISKNKLSNQDLRYAAYIYLNMDNQQIANILKVEQKTVRMTKYRLKQKIGLEKEQDLTVFLQNLEL